MGSASPSFVNGHASTAASTNTNTLRNNGNEPSSTSSTDSRLEFLSLPLEIRRHIYSFLFGADHNRTTTPEGGTSYSFSLSLFATSKQVAAEAREVFEQRNVFIALDTPWTVAEQHVREQGRVPMIAAGDKVQHFKNAHMSVQINTRDAQYSESFVFVILVDDLERFCRFWYYSDLSYPGLNRALTLKLSATSLLTKRTTVSRDLQRRLLMPFGDIKDLDDLAVEGFDDEIKQELITAQAKPYESPESCIERCGNLKDAADLSVKQKNYQKALSQYFAAFDAIHITIDGRERRVWADAFFDLTLQRGKHTGENANILRIEFRIRLVAAVVYAYMQLAQYDEARYWGLRSISLMRDNLGPAADEPRNPFPAAREWGHIYLWTGQACKYLDRVEEARELFQIANKWLPGDGEVRREVRELGGTGSGGGQGMNNNNGRNNGGGGSASYGNYVMTEDA